MNAALENDLVAWLENTITSTVIVPATNPGAKPTQVPFVIAKVSDVAPVVGALHDATVEVYVGTPILDGTDSSTAHNDLSKAAQARLKALVGDAELSADWRCGGVAITRVRDAHSSSEWMTVIELLLGLEQLEH